MELVKNKLKGELNIKSNLKLFLLSLRVDQSLTQSANLCSGMFRNIMDSLGLPSFESVVKVS